MYPTNDDLILYEAGPRGPAGEVTQDALDAAVAALGGAIALKLDAAALDVDPALTANSDAKIASQKAVKTYVAAFIAAQDVMVFKGLIDCSANPNYPAASKGHQYRVSVAGRIGGGTGPKVENGDILICLVDGSPSGSHGAVGANWGIIQTNIDGAATVDGAQTLTNKTISGAANSLDVALNRDVTGIITPMGRLTLTADVAVSDSVSGANTIYYTPYLGNLLPLYDGSVFKPRAFAQLSQALSDTTKSPAAATANSVYDLFVWDDAGVLRCTRGPAWANSTTRSAGTALTRINGILVNNVAIANGPAARRGTYVGTIATNDAGTVDNIRGGAGAETRLMVWNYYNRVSASYSASEASYWTYTSAAVRPANNTGNARVTFVTGLAEDTVVCSCQWLVRLLGVSGAYAFVGVGFDSTSAMAISGELSNPTTVQHALPFAGRRAFPPVIGVHYFQMLEQGDGANANYFYGSPYSFVTVDLRN